MMTTYQMTRALLASTLTCLSFAAMADSDRLMPSKVPNAYQQECASCHLAYPPGLLPARSWKNMMSNLEHHYGTDASIDAQTAKEITAWLTDHAGTYKRVKEAPRDDRITMSTWFERKHRKVEEEVWLRDSVKSRANCAACHTQAERGNYDDDHVVIPK